jgi:hypothetical protein
MRIHAIVLFSLLATSAAFAQTATAPDIFSTTLPTTDVTEEADEKKWTFSLSAYWYIVEDDEDYVQPTVRADYDWLHLEARYNYEDQDTTSVWVGYNFSFGDKLTLDFTPMIGGVLGRTEGVAPGYEVTLAWRGFELYSEGELLIDTEDSSDSFFYTWSELTWSPVEWLRVGVVIQRTKAYDSDFDIQRGLMVGVTYKKADFAVYLFNPDDDPIVVLGVSYDF